MAHMDCFQELWGHVAESVRFTAFKCFQRALNIHQAKSISFVSFHVQDIRRHVYNNAAGSYVCEDKFEFENPRRNP